MRFWICVIKQANGLIPIVIEPYILRDNYDKLVELSDISFSSGRFVNGFDQEVLTSFDFLLDETKNLSPLTFGFSLDRPNARGGAENWL